MKRTLTLALTVVLGSMIATQAIAQEAFPDTPENHWAYEALAKMRAAGLLVGYPDGLYRGARPASRYEMAVALYALYQHLKGLTDGLDSRVKMLEGAKPQQVNLDEIKKMIQDLQGQINGMKAWGDDIANLKKMAATFEKELASMGVDIEALKKGLNDLADRVTALEKRKPAVDIHGNVALHMAAGYSEDGRYGITVDGRPTGVSNGDGEPANFTRDMSMFHAADFALSGTNDTGPKWKAVLSVNNMLGGNLSDGPGGGFGFGNMSHTWDGIPFGEATTDVYFREFSISDKSAFLGQDFGWRMGRIGKQLGSYFLKRPDNTPYYSNEYWDNGDWIFDGVDLQFGIGNTNLSLFGGKVSSRLSTNGVDLNPMWAGQYNHIFEPGGDTGNNPNRPRGLSGGALGIDTMFGGQLALPIGGKNKVNLNYLILDSDSVTTLSGSSLQADRVAVFGGDVKFNLGGFDAMAGYSQTNIMLGDTNVVDEDNAAWWVNLGREYDRWGFRVGYRSIDPQFYAPGSWGRIGIWWNPSDIQGFYGMVNFKVNSKLNLGVNGGMYEGRDLTVNGGQGLSSDDEVTHYALNLNYSVSDSTTLWLGTEAVNWDLAARPSSSFAGGETDELWYNIGLKYRMTDNAWWSFQWQISDYDGKGVAGMNPFGGFSSDTRATGGFITTTLSLKF